MDFGSTYNSACFERLRTGPFDRAPNDRMYLIKIRMLGAFETYAPHIRTRLARKGELTSLGWDGDWEILQLRTRIATRADLDCTSEENIYALVVIEGRYVNDLPR